MAQRRMFSKQVTNSSEFLMMSQSAQNLYFHFGMNADDDGFCEIFTVMRMTESKPDDLQSLNSRGFIFVVDNKVCVVKDWHENNQLRSDRYKQSPYLEIEKYREIYKIIMQDKIKEISQYSRLLEPGKPNGNQMEPQYSIGKGRIPGETKVSQEFTIEEESEKSPRVPKDTSYLQVFELWGKYPMNWKMNRTEIAAAKNILAEHEFSHAKKALAFAQAHKDEENCPQILKPSDLDRKWVNLQAFRDKRK